MLDMDVVLTSQRLTIASVTVLLRSLLLLNLEIPVTQLLDVPPPGPLILLIATATKISVTLQFTRSPTSFQSYSQSFYQFTFLNWLSLRKKNYCMN